ncbi:MAG: carbohydrate ABC transporter permease [Acidimicrobiia bacterium]|jgi:ABC-type sugar transport system permease subunit
MGTLVSTVVNVTIALVVAAGLFVALNLAIGRTPQRWDDRLRPWIFVGPALVFLMIGLVVPAARTVFLSFRAGGSGEDGFTTDNWTTLLTSDSVLSFERVGDIFTSRLFLVGVVLAAIGLVAARRAGGQGGALETANPVSGIAWTAAVLAVLMAALSTLRGVIWNNLWWVVVVAGLATVFGLGLAVLADRSRNESLAKTLIFMPMAISMVGAAVIWQFIYDTPGAGQAEGLLNIIWPGPPVDFLRGTTSTGTIAPWNNFFIMVIMIWIQAGFAMVVISAAIKSVPTELGEAARVDGASEPQVFWQVTLPQITGTILVVVTTLTITVLKVFDLVKATTGGTADTDVLANRVYDTLRSGNFTISSTYAVIILLLVLPIMYLNVRRNRAEIR